MPQVYAHILNALTSGLYIQVNIALREYLQNAYDAIKEARLQGLPEPKDHFHVEVKITRDSQNVTISDNGVGMDQRLLEEYTSIGGGTRNSPEYAGHKGIGKLAGLRFFEHFVVRTKEAGSDTGHQLSWRSGEMMRTLQSHPEQMKRVPYEEFIKKYVEIKAFSGAEVDLHYTQVQLINVMEEFRDQISEEAIGEFIRANCPVPFHPERFEHADAVCQYLGSDFVPVSTYLNDKVGYQPFNDEQHLVAPVKEDIKYNDNLRAKAWFSWVKDSAEVIPDERIRGIKFRCKGICVGDRNLFANFCMPVGRDLVAHWFTGEICVIDDDIRPNTARDGFEKSEGVRKFYDEIKKKLGKTLSGLATVRSEIHAAEQDLFKVEKARLEGRAPSVQELRKLGGRAKELRKCREKARYSLDFGVITKLEMMIAATESGADEEVSEVAKRAREAIAGGSTEKVVDALLELKTHEVRTPSKKAKKEIGQLIGEAKEVLEEKAKQQSESGTGDWACKIVDVLVKYLEHRKLPYDRREVEEFVTHVLRK